MNDKKPFIMRVIVLVVVAVMVLGIIISAVTGAF